MNTKIVEDYITKNKLLTDGANIIVGVSGGADSVALLDVLHSLQYNCIVAHCNFHLRGEESNRDAFFVENLCHKYGLTFESIDFDTEVYAETHSISIEMAARELRYDWFERLRKMYSADYIAVAHHQDDSVETILLNLARGTGIRGLTGISPKNGYVIRPLLCVGRHDIMVYLKERELTYVDDSTNSEDLYTRNKIRLNIIPSLEEINPSVKQAILRTSENLSQVRSIYEYYMEQVKADILYDNKIDILKLLKCVEPKAILFEILATYNFSSAVIHQIFESLVSQSGKTFYSDSYVLVRDRQYFLLKERQGSPPENFIIQADKSSISYPLNLEIEVIDKVSEFKIDKNSSTLYLDRDKLVFPLVVRRWQIGDWFIPFGMKGKKKLSDFFSDNKYSLFDKEEAWILVSGNGDILWIIGKRSDERYKVTEYTKKILRITLN